MQRTSSLLGAVLLAVVLLLQVGCQPVLSDFMAKTPNHDKTIKVDRPPLNDFQRSLFGVEIPEPEASIAVWVIEPKDQPEPVGTVMILHGFKDKPFWMLDKAKDLTEVGYRAVLVALRGHGGSTGKYHTFGVVEQHDMVAVIDELEQRGLIAGKLGLWGMSYGSTVGIQTAAIDDRIQAVVGIAGFSSVRRVSVEYCRTLLPVVGWVMSEESIQAIVDKAGDKAGYDPDEAEAIDAIAQIEVPVLILHGEWDLLVPHTHGEILREAGGENVQMISLPITGHLGAWFDLSGDVRRHGIAFLDEHLR